MMMMNYFCGMVDQWKVFTFISSRDHCQSFSPSRISNMPWARLESAQNLNSDFVEWGCAVMITTTQWPNKSLKLYVNFSIPFIASLAAILLFWLLTFFPKSSHGCKSLSLPSSLGSVLFLLIFRVRGKIQLQCASFCASFHKSNK